MRYYKSSKKFTLEKELRKMLLLQMINIQMFQNLFSEIYKNCDCLKKYY